MPEKKSNLPAELKAQAADYVTASAKGVLGVVPFAGSFLAEIAGTVIPNQRVDRIAQFAAELQARIDGIEQSALRPALEDEHFIELAEESLRQAARSTSADRREYLASVVANSLTGEALTHAENQTVLRLLGQLTDVEIIWLRFFWFPVLNGDHEFREKHAEVLKPLPAYLSSSQAEIDRHALQEAARQHLRDLGLVSESIETDRAGNPVFDKRTKQFKVGTPSTTMLGDLLLRSIGLTHPAR